MLRAVLGGGRSRLLTARVGGTLLPLLGGSSAMDGAVGGGGGIFAGSERSGARALHSSRPAGARRNLYEVLGVPRDADKKDIKKAYYRLAKKLHPDANKDDDKAADKFAEVTEAYEVLSDADKRAAYDRYGDAAIDMDAGMGGGGPGGGNPFGGGAGFNPEDLFGSFDDLFGGRAGASSGPRRGADVPVSLPLSFLEAVHGTKKTVSVAMRTVCGTCDGTRAAPGSSPRTCPVCFGKGHQTVTRGFLNLTAPCGTCHGEGQLIDDPCHTCGARGWVHDTRHISVKVPEGVDNGTTLRIAGKGEPGEAGGPAGNLYVELSVADDPFFTRHGADVHVEVPITISQAVMGAKVPIPTLRGEVDLKIPSGVQPGSKLKLRGKGIKQLNRNAYGNQYVELAVRIPKSLTDEQLEVMQAWAKLEEDVGESEEAAGESGFFKDVLNRLADALAGSSDKSSS
eukprot:PLAT3867.3.p1 GENE.PLAT3867.3~~PLAT3867.3.p1  ORF type:complete len:463 (+),score=199.17 PLAT3867.3:30-1391(+)